MRTLESPESDIQTKKHPGSSTAKVPIDQRSSSLIDFQLSSPVEGPSAMDIPLPPSHQHQHQQQHQQSTSRINSVRNHTPLPTPSQTFSINNNNTGNNSNNKKDDRKLTAKISVLFRKMGGSKSETHLDAIGGEETDEDSSSVRSRTGSISGDIGGFFKGVSRGLSKMTSMSSFRRRNGSDPGSNTGTDSPRTSTASAVSVGSVSPLANVTTAPPTSPVDSYPAITMHDFQSMASPPLPPLPPPSPARDISLPPITPVSAAWSFEEGAADVLKMPASSHFAESFSSPGSRDSTFVLNPAGKESSLVPTKPVSILSHSNSDRTENHGDNPPKPPSHNRKPSIKIHAPSNSPLSNIDMPVHASPNATRRSFDTTGTPSRRSTERTRAPNDHMPLPHPPSFSLPRIPSSPLHLSTDDEMQPQEFMNWLQSQAVVEEKDEVNVVEESDLMASVLAVAKKPVRRAKSFAERHVVITPENMEEFADGKEAPPKEIAGSIASVGRVKGLAPLRRGKKATGKRRTKGGAPSDGQEGDEGEDGNEVADSPAAPPIIVTDGTAYPPPQPPSPTATHPSLSRFGSGGRRSSISSAVSRRSSVLSIHGNPLENADLPGGQEMEGGERVGPLATIMHAEAIVAKAVAETIIKEEIEEKKEAEVEEAKEEGSESDEEDESSVDGSVDEFGGDEVVVAPGRSSTDGMQLPLHPISPFHRDTFVDDAREAMPKQQRIIPDDDVPPPPPSASPFISNPVAPIESKKSPRLPASPTISTSKLATYVQTASSPTSPKEPPPPLKGLMGRKGEGKNPWTWLSKILTPKKKAVTDTTTSTLAERVLGTKSVAAVDRSRRSSDSIHDDHWEDNVYPHDALSSSRYPLHIEKAVYRLSHIKLAQPRRPLHEQVVVSNLMLYILSVHADVTLNRGGPRGRKKKGKKRSRSGKRGRSSSQGSIEVSPGRSGRRNQQGYIMPDDGSMNMESYDQPRGPSLEMGIDGEEGQEPSGMGGGFPNGFVGLPAPPPGQDGMPPHPMLMYPPTNGAPYPPHFNENGIVTPMPFNGPPLSMPMMMHMPPMPNGQQINGMNQMNGMNGPAYYPPFDPTFHLQPYGNAFPLPIPQPPQINRTKSQDTPLVNLGETGEGSSTMDAVSTSSGAGSAPAKKEKKGKRRGAKTGGRGSDSDESVKSNGSVRSNASARSKTSVRSSASTASKRAGRGRGAAAAVAAEALQGQVGQQQHTPVSLFYGSGFGYQQPGGVPNGRVTPQQQQRREDDDEDLVPLGMLQSQRNRRGSVASSTSSMMSV
ncbi:hypothetical protein HDU97_004243 [Phlyctochytrium planicorne]|nr:hypothetical protein HDU97_004243 [Phlyctochytrium planicorne]